MKERIANVAKDIVYGDVYADMVSVDYDPMDLALPEAKLISKRVCEYMLAQTVTTDDWQTLFGHFRFDGSVTSELFRRTGHKHFMEACSKIYCKPMDNLMLFEWQHATPNYERIVKRGIAGVKNDIATYKCYHKADKEKTDFLEAMDEICDGIIAWAHKCGDECFKKAQNEKDAERRAELERAYKTLYKVPEFPAETFYEAMQVIYMCYEYLPDGIGTIDRLLYPYYKKDIENGILTRDDAKELLQCLFLRIQSQCPADFAGDGGDGGDRRTKGGECHFAIGGYNALGEDCFNDLSKLIVEAIMEMPMHIPQVSLRWTKKTPREVLRFMLDCERNDKYKRIALVNDEPRIKGFMENLNMSYEDAVKYTMVGCNEPAFPGAVWFEGGTANIARSISDVLHKDSERAVACKSFEEFYALYEEHLEADIDEIIEYSNKFNSMKAKDINVLSAIMLDGCIENAESPTRGGCRIKLGGSNLMGLTCLIDSISIVKQFVYDEKIVTMEHLIEALKSNWETDPELRTRILKTGKFFGNSYDLSDNIAIMVTDSLHKFTKDKRLMNGEHILFGTLTGYNTHYATYGGLTPATPDGRYAGDAFMVGVGQSFGKDREGLSALLASVAKMQPSGILCGPYLCNVRVDKVLVKEDEYFEKLVDQIETYFKLGGMHIQLNYVSKEELLEAQAEPEKHGNMKVRVSGFSGVFVGLNKNIQNDVINRTEINS